MSNDDTLKSNQVKLAPLNEVFPDRVKKARQGALLSQHELAKRITQSGNPTTPGAIGMWEQGRATPTVDNLRRIAVLLNTPADELLGIAHLFKGKTSKEIALAERFSKLTPAEQGIISTLLESLERMRPARQHKK